MKKTDIEGRKGRTASVSGRYALAAVPNATRRLEEITPRDLKAIQNRAPTAPERTISGGVPIHPKVVKGLVEQQREADNCFRALTKLGEELERI